MTEGKSWTQRNIWLIVGMIIGLYLFVGFPDQEIPEEPDSSINASDESFRYEQTEFGPSLVFSIAISNDSPTPLTVYAFGYASNDNHSPPARGVFPLRAIKHMGDRRAFRAPEPALGHEIRLDPGERSTLDGGIIVPSRWHDGTPIQTKQFYEFTLYLYDASGSSAYKKTWRLY